MTPDERRDQLELIRIAIQSRYANMSLLVTELNTVVTQAFNALIREEQNG